MLFGGEERGRGRRLVESAQEPAHFSLGTTIYCQNRIEKKDRNKEEFYPNANETCAEGDGAHDARGNDCAVK